jgi:hypothetical protein
MDSATAHDELLENLQKFEEKVAEYEADVALRRAFWRNALMAGCDIPYDAFRGSQYHSIGQTKFNEESREYELDEEATVKEIAKYVQFARTRGYKVEKKYTEDDFNVYIEVPGVRGKFNLYTTRKVVCKRVVVGTEIVPAVPEQEKEIVEWQCDKIAFLNVEV